VSTSPCRERSPAVANGLLELEIAQRIGEDGAVSGPPRTRSMAANIQTMADGTLNVIFEGAIDEKSDLAAAFALITRPAILNLRGVSRVNSMGVHSWIPAISKCSAQHRLALEEISYALVQNANVVANLFGSAELRSCMAPYFCVTCSENFALCVTREEVAESGGEPPERTCARCGSALEFDELDGYFSFLTRRRGR
jgi:anti-anti-sigma regulatory factor